MKSKVLLKLREQNYSLEEVTEQHISGSYTKQMPLSSNLFSEQENSSLVISQKVSQKEPNMTWGNYRRYTDCMRGGKRFMQKDLYNERIFKALPKELTATTKASQPLLPICISSLDITQALRKTTNFDLPDTSFFQTYFKLYLSHAFNTPPITKV